MAIFESDPPSDERCIENPPKGTHITEPNNGFVVRVGRERFVAKPEEQDQRRKQHEQENRGTLLESRGGIAIAIDDLRKQRIFRRARVVEMGAKVASDRNGSLDQDCGILMKIENGFQNVRIWELKL